MSSLSLLSIQGSLARGLPTILVGTSFVTTDKKSSFQAAHAWSMSVAADTAVQSRSERRLLIFSKSAWSYSHNRRIEHETGAVTLKRKVQSRITWSDFPNGGRSDARKSRDGLESSTRSSSEVGRPPQARWVGKLIHWCSPSCRKTGSRARPALL